MPAPVVITLRAKELDEFTRRRRSGKTPVRIKERLSIVLLADEGLSNAEIAGLLPDPLAFTRLHISEAVGYESHVCCPSVDSSPI